MSEDLPKGEGRGKAVARRRWWLYVQVLTILLLVGAGIGLVLREAPSSNTPGWKVRALVAGLEREDSDDLLSELLRKLIPRYGDGRDLFEVSGDLTALGVEAVPEIITATGHRVPSVRWAAAEALGDIGDRRAVAPLADLLAQDTDWEVREVAAYSLGQLGGPEATARLTEAMTDPEQEVREAAREALQRIRQAGQSQAPGAPPQN